MTSPSSPSAETGAALREAKHLLSDLSLGKSIQNDRFPDRKIEGPLWDKIGDVIQRIDAALALTAPTQIKAGETGEAEHVLAIIERELGSWECNGPDEMPTTVSGLIKSERAIFRDAQHEACPICGGDCAGANPPVANCPLALSPKPGETIGGEALLRELEHHRSNSEQGLCRVPRETITKAIAALSAPPKGNAEGVKE